MHGGATLESGSGSTHKPLSCLNSCQRSVVARVARRVSACGAPPSELCSHEALQELLHTHDFYSAEQKNLGSYVFERVKILHSGPDPKDLRDRASGEAVTFYNQAERLIFRDATEMSLAAETDPVITPYWDPIRKNDVGERLRFYEAL